MKYWINVCCLILTLISGSVYAKKLEIPLKLDNAFIERLLEAQIFTDKNASLRLTDDGSGCQYIELSNPNVSTSNQYLKVRVKAKVRLGQRLAKKCLFLVQWNGYVDLYHEAKISPEGKKVTIDVKKSNILSQKLVRDPMADTLWQGVQSQLYLKFQSLEIDLKPPIENLKAVLPDIVVKKNAKIFRKAMDSIKVSSVKMKKYGVLLLLNVNVPDLVPVAKHVQALSDAELDLLEKKLNAIDALTTFTIKYFSKSTTSKNIQFSLLQVLLDMRYEIVDILAAPQRFDVDPVRVLFLNTWQRLSPIIRQISNQNKNALMSLRILSFVTANDALASLDKYGPDLGLDISIEGLTRLARLLNNDPNVNPIEHNEDLDPQLRKLLGMDQALMSPQSQLENKWLDFFITPVVASGRLPKKLTNKLNNWVPKKHEIRQYLPMVKKVLAAVSQNQLDANKLSKPIRVIYRNLVYATAWQESCWKQFSNIKGFRKPLKSYTGDIGLMQINPRVWRGFYSVHKLKWDIVYNGNAGAEILMHYMTRYVIKNREHIRTGKMENLARATYSGYNGGPSKYKRYRKKNISGRLKKIDRAFYKKYKAVRDKGSMSVRSCFVSS